MAAHVDRIIGAHPSISHMGRDVLPYNPGDLCAATANVGNVAQTFQELFSKIVEKDAKLTKDDFVYHVPRLRRGGP